MSFILPPAHDDATAPSADKVHEGLECTARHAWDSRASAATPGPVQAAWRAAELWG
jgi:hypothetical protein